MFVTVAVTVEGVDVSVAITVEATIYSGEFV